MNENETYNYYIYINVESIYNLVSNQLGNILKDFRKEIAFTILDITEYFIATNNKGLINYLLKTFHNSKEIFIVDENEKIKVNSENTYEELKGLYYSWHSQLQINKSLEKQIEYVQEEVEKIERKQKKEQIKEIEQSILNIDDYEF